jgi:hypothetical protein
MKILLSLVSIFLLVASTQLVDDQN